MEIGNLPEKEFRVIIVKMIQDLGKRMEAQIKKIQEIFNKDIEELKSKQTEMNNTITEMKNTLHGISSRINEAEEEEKKNRTEKIFEEIIVENFPNMGKEIVNQVQEAQRVPYTINPRKNTPRHINQIIKN